MADEEQNLSVPRAADTSVLTPESAIGWSCKNEILKVAAHAEQQFNEAVVVGASESSELVALVFGYSPEGCHRRAVQIAANPSLLAALTGLLDHYVQIVVCGDCGNWDAEAEPPVIGARAAIAQATGEGAKT